MALAIAQIGGNSTAVSSADSTSQSFGSNATSGSVIVGVSCVYATNSAWTAGMMTDNKSNTYQLAGSTNSGLTEQVACHYNNNGTRTSGTFTLTVNPAGAASSICLGLIEITGQDQTNSTSCFDATTLGTANDTTSPFAVTAAAAISGNQIAVYACTIGGQSGNVAITGPSGYTDVIKSGDADTNLVHLIGYKINETGTPSPSCTWSGTVGSESPREMFVTFKEAAAAGTKAGAFPSPHMNPLMRRK